LPGSRVSAGTAEVVSNEKSSLSTDKKKHPGEVQNQIFPVLHHCGPNFIVSLEYFTGKSRQGSRKSKFNIAIIKCCSLF
jgi:hypothetical protein